LLQPQWQTTNPSFQPKLRGENHMIFQDEDVMSTDDSVDEDEVEELDGEDEEDEMNEADEASDEEVM